MTLHGKCETQLSRPVGVASYVADQMGEGNILSGVSAPSGEGNKMVNRSLADGDKHPANMTDEFVPCCDFSPSESFNRSIVLARSAARSTSRSLFGVPNAPVACVGARTFSICSITSTSTSARLGLVSLIPVVVSLFHAIRVGDPSLPCILALVVGVLLIPRAQVRLAVFPVVLRRSLGALFHTVRVGISVPAGVFPPSLGIGLPRLPSRLACLCSYEF